VTPAGVLSSRKQLGLSLDGQRGRLSAGRASRSSHRYDRGYDVDARVWALNGRHYGRSSWLSGRSRPCRLRGCSAYLEDWVAMRVVVAGTKDDAGVDVTPACVAPDGYPVSSLSRTGQPKSEPASGR
jgi:hypothetical protein